MSDDISNVPRRLRRFVRKGEPIPEDENNSERSPPQPVDDKSPEDEPWMNPRANVPRRMQRKTTTTTRTSSISIPSPPRGMYEKMNENAQPSVTHLDKTLGLEKKVVVQESLPAESGKAIQTVPPSADVQAALSKLKELAARDNQNGSSFHFTPVGSAPTPVEPAKLDEKNNPPIPGNAYLSPRERMEARKQRGGEPPEGSPSASSGRPPTPSRETESMAAGTPAHIRRRMGQRPDASQSEMDSSEPAGNAPMSNMENEDFKSLFGDEKKKKKKTSDEDFDDMGLGDDMPLLDDEK